MTTGAAVVAVLVAVIGVATCASGGSTGGWNMAPNTQYHIQTDEGPERYFKYQTISGQYRKEKRLQDGTVVGSYGWVDPNGYLLLRDYVADDSGYRVVRTKNVFVGKDAEIGGAVSKAKSAPSQGGTGVEPLVVSTTPAPPSSAAPTTATPTSTPTTAAPPLGASYNYNPLLYPSFANSPSNYLAGGYTQQRPYYSAPSERRYDGISATHNGFRYFLPRQYHEEENLPGYQTAGSFGYVDPFGIRRVIYYNTSPGSGFVHRKNNRYVGLDAPPYDPRF